MNKTHKILNNRKVTHTAWSITQCPCFSAEMTVWWFLTGKRFWGIKESLTYNVNYYGKKI